MAELEFASSPIAGNWYATDSRIDPYYQGLWEGNDTSISWTNAALAARQVEAGLGRLPAPWKMSRERAIEVVTAPHRRRELIVALGALWQWHTVSGAQLAAFSGYRSLGSSFATVRLASDILAALFTLNLVEFGQSTAGLWALQRDKAPLIYRLSRTRSAWGKIISPTLSWAERLAITGGMTANAGRAGNRHNVLSSELGLRAAEVLPIATVLGERMCNLHAMAFDSAGMSHPSKTTASADLAIVRNDGLRIAIETTATTNADFPAKVERWTRILSQTPFEESGLVVCFLEALPVGRTETQRLHALSKMRAEISRAARFVHPGSTKTMTAQRIMVASWQDWFPSEHTFSPDFLTMRAIRPISMGEDPWRPVDMLDDLVDLPFRSTRGAKSLIDATASLAGTPSFLRKNLPTPNLDLPKIAAASLDINEPIEIEAINTRGDLKCEPGQSFGETTKIRRLSWPN